MNTTPELDAIRQEMLIIRTNPEYRDQRSGTWLLPDDNPIRVRFMELGILRAELQAAADGKPSPSAVREQQQQAWNARLEQALSLKAFARLSAPVQFNGSQWDIVSSGKTYRVSWLSWHHKYDWRCSCSTYRHEGRCRHADLMRFMNGADLDLSIYDAPHTRPDWVKPRSGEVDAETAEIREQLNDIHNEHKNRQY